MATVTIDRLRRQGFSLVAEIFFFTLLSTLTLAVTGFNDARANESWPSNQSKNIAELPLKIALLHLATEFADIPHNVSLVERAMRSAAAQGANWVVTPELALTGYRFDLKIGTGWITVGPDAHVQHLQKVALELGVVLFLSHLEQPNANGPVYNTLFVIDSQGEIIGRHRKINTIAVSEAWSTAGAGAKPVEVDGRKVGLLICADAWPGEHAASLKQQGAELLISSASWAPGKYGPGDTWEKRSLETGLPVLVANRTGVEREFDLTQSSSVVSINGERIADHRSLHSSFLLMDWPVAKSLESMASYLSYELR